MRREPGQQGSRGCLTEDDASQGRHRRQRRQPEAGHREWMPGHPQQRRQDGRHQPAGCSITYQRTHEATVGGAVPTQTICRGGHVTAEQHRAVVERVPDRHLRLRQLDTQLREIE